MWLLSSCSSYDLPDARNAFYQGNYQQAEEEIGTDVVDGKDSVLVLMERGTIYQAEGEYEKSSMDFIRAYDTLDVLQTYSVSEGAGSWVINDTVYSFEGSPYEQTLLHSMTAMNHLAMGNWEDGGVEARRIIFSLTEEERGEEYPDDAFSRYLAAFILEMTGDGPNARSQYKMANELLPDLHIDEKGQISSEESASSTASVQGQELVVFFLIGHSPTMREIRGQFKDSFHPPQIQVYTKEKYLGNATVLSRVDNLALITWNIEAPARIAKMVARIAAKEAIAVSVEKQDAVLGALTRIILIGMLERPDFRRWETLPRWLAVARLPCPETLNSFEVAIQGEGNIMGKRFAIDYPIVKRGDVFFSFVRDLPGFNSPKLKKEIDKVQ